MGKKFKPAKYTQQSGEVGSRQSSPDTGIDYPIFCFKHLHRDYDLERCSSGDIKFTKALLQKIRTLTSQRWVDINLLNRQHGGFEKIQRTQLSPPPAGTITEDVEEVISFYFAGDRARLIGHKDESIFHVLYIDTSLSVYKHPG